MMRATILFIAIAILSFSCDAGLTKDQRKALKEEMEKREIKRISQEDIYKKALEEGKAVFQKLQNQKNIAVVANECKCEIKYSKSEEGLSEKSKAIFLAYSYDPTGEDNIQKEDDNLVYSKPQVVNDSLQGVWFITFKKNEITKML